MPEKDLLQDIQSVHTRSFPSLPSCSALFSHSGTIPPEREYVVSLQSRQLGMTIENVLERTIVRSVHPNSEAFRLNVKTNSIILSIGASRYGSLGPMYRSELDICYSTTHQTHLETLETLKNTARPVKLRLCEVDSKVPSLNPRGTVLSHLTVLFI
jgi:hypothetical protein